MSLTRRSRLTILLIALAVVALALPFRRPDQVPRPLPDRRRRDDRARPDREHRSPRLLDPGGDHRAGQGPTRSRAKPRSTRPSGP